MKSFNIFDLKIKKIIIGINYLFLFWVLVIFCSCSEEEEVIPFGPTQGTGLSDSDWSIPMEQVFDGGPGKDGIPSIDNPQFIGSEEAKYFGDSDLVIGYKSGNEIKAYPHAILDWHEIINDEINGDRLSITYCPLTGTAVAWNRIINGKETTFGVTGLLYNTNLMPYDRETNSVWSQMLNSSVFGELKKKEIDFFPLVETTWKTWKEMYPNTKVVSEDTGFSRNYGLYPYGSYKEIERTLFPINTTDDRLFSKERVLGVIMDWGAKLYRFESIDPDNSGKINVILDSFGPESLIIVGNKDFMVAYRTSGIIGAMDFTPLQDQLPLLFKDNIGNKYDAFGIVQEGQNRGERLSPVNSFIGFFFSFGTFYPTPEIYGL